jgi:hypothetical protein
MNRCRETGGQGVTQDKYVLLTSIKLQITNKLEIPKPNVQNVGYFLQLLSELKTQSPSEIVLNLVL